MLTCQLFMSTCEIIMLTFNLNYVACQHYDNCCRNKLHVNKSVLYTDLNHLASMGQKYATKTPNNDCRCWNLVIFTHSFKKAGMLGSVVLENDYCYSVSDLKEGQILTVEMEPTYVFS